jgi:membrane-bound lytic murein transglycosylase MltF
MQVIQPAGKPINLCVRPTRAEETFSNIRSSMGILLAHPSKTSFIYSTLPNIAGKRYREPCVYYTVGKEASRYRDRIRRKIKCMAQDTVYKLPYYPIGRDV